jgi:glycosyltransferase 2 family protein
MKFIGSRWMRILFHAVGVALFAVILTRVDLGAIWSAYRHIELSRAVAGIALLFVLTLLKSLRWRRIVSTQGIAVPVFMSFRIYAASLYLGVVTPGHIGDFAKSLYLTRKGMTAGKAIFSSLADRLFDIVFLAVIGYASLLSFPGIFSNQLLMSSLLLGLVAITVAALFCRRELLKRFVRKFLSGMPNRGIRASIDRVITEGIGEFGLLGIRTSAIAGLLTLGAWIAHYFFFIIFAKALGIGASIPLLIVSVSAAVFVSLIPISLSGLGTRDLALILIFGRAGLTREAAVTFSFAFIFVYLIQGIVGLLCWLSVPLHSKKALEARAEREVS